MGIILISFSILFVLILEHRINLRQKYQHYTERFTRYYIDFLVILLAAASILGIFCLLSFIKLPGFVVECILIFLTTYSLFVILPIRAFDGVLGKIFRN
ncbi:MAG: hypothetical protein K0R50_799 [Eubacterium sp.]|jgi:hypothetical protein|nr:hypothetical protein [Eubacterium sp.]